MRQRAIIGGGDVVALQVPGRPSRCNHCEPTEGSFCAGISSEDEHRLAAILDLLRIGDGSTLFREGDPALHLYAIASGAVKLYKLLPDGRRQITGFLFRGDVFGLPMDGGYAYTAETMGPVLLCRFDRRRLEGVFLQSPGLERRLLGAVAHELAVAHDQMLLLGRKSAREKVASFLLALWRRKVTRGLLPSVISLPMSRADIGDFLGLTIETVSRVLTQFKREGLILIPDAMHISVARAEELARIAEGS